LSVDVVQASICICDGFNLLLPSAAIAEAVSGVTASLETEAKFPWYQGEVHWRGLVLPLVSFEQLLIQRNPRLRGSHIAIVRSQVEADLIPFFGVPVQTVPTSFDFSRDMAVEEGNDDGRLDFVTQYVRVRGVNTVIPDLAAIESHVASCLNSSG
jgi:chemotaxis signal transduction protein